MNGRVLMLAIGTVIATPAHAGFWGHVAGTVAGVVAGHEATRAIDAYADHREGDNRPAQALPDPKITPGRINPEVTQQNLDRTICRPGGFTRSIRPPEDYTEKLKRKQIEEYHYSDRRLGHYEEDHLISLELGGSPDDPRNLWPEPHHAPGGWGSFAKDSLENRLHSLVCSGHLSLATAQWAIATNWVTAYKKYIGNTAQ